MLTVAVAGCGYWGPNLLRNFNALKECRVKFACDQSTERLAHMKRLYPEVDVTTNFDLLLDDSEINAIVIATPAGTHFELGKKSLEAGKHTFIEKPMATSSEACKELIRLADEKGLTLMVGYTFVYSSPVRKIKEIVDSGDLGKLLYISTRRLNLGLFQKDINVAWDLAPHDISVMLYVLQEKPMAVSCHGKAHVNPNVEDVTSMTVDFDQDTFGIIQSSWLDPNKVREMTFVGSQRMLVYDDLAPSEKIRIYDKRVETPPYYDTFAEFQYSYHYGDMYAPYLVEVEPLKVECDHFLSCIESGEKPRSGGVEGLNVVQVLEAASASLKNGGAKVRIS